MTDTIYEGEEFHEFKTCEGAIEWVLRKFKDHQGFNHDKGKGAKLRDDLYIHPFAATKKLRIFIFAYQPGRIKVAVVGKKGEF